MAFTLDDLAIAYPDRLWLEFSPEERNQIWQECQNYSNDWARWNAYLNYLCLQVILRWLQEENDSGENPEPLWDLEVFKHLWETINGSAIALGETRIVLIPTDEIDTETFCVPQEWVDLPKYAGDYYLAAIVEPDECLLKVWGYCNYQHLKAKAEYYESDRIYCLEREFIIEDLNVMWIGRELCPPKKPQVEPLASLSGDEAIALIEILAQRSPYSPRLEVEFTKWGALLERENLVKMLYERRLEAAQSSAPVNLKQWLQGITETAWQKLEDILTPEQVQLGYGFRGALTIERGQNIDLGVELDLPKNESETLAMRSPKPSFWRGLLEGQSVALMVMLSPETETEVDVRFQVYPTGQHTYLPEGLKLIILDESQEEVMETESRQADNIIQLGIGAEFGEKFSVVVAWREARVKKEFFL